MFRKKNQVLYMVGYARTVWNETGGMERNVLAKTDKRLYVFAVSFGPINYIFHMHNYIFHTSIQRPGHAVLQLYAII